MRDRRQRATRGSAVGALSVLAGAVGHHIAGGSLPGWLAVVVGLAFAVPLGILLVARRPSLPRTAAVVTLSQGAFHYLFAELGSPALPSGPHVHGLPQLPGAAPMHSMDAGAHLTDPAMAAAHLLAAALTLALLRGAETALVRLLVRRIVGTLAVALPIPPQPPRRPLVAGATVPPVSRRVVAGLPRRGPPTLSLA